MNKPDLINTISDQTAIERSKVEKVINTFTEVVMKKLQAGQEVTLTGFGTFLSRHRHARMGVNPQNPTEKIKIPEVVVPKFKAGKTLKDALKK